MAALTRIQWMSQHRNYTNFKVGVPPWAIVSICYYHEWLNPGSNTPPSCTMLPTKYVHIKSTTVYAPRRNWDSPQPPSRMLVCPLPPVSGGRGTLAGEKGVGRVPIPTRGIHCGTLYMYVLCDDTPSRSPTLSPPCKQGMYRFEIILRGGTTWTGDLKCREVKTGYCRKR
jgi:hypothetical protein